VRGQPVEAGKLDLARQMRRRATPEEELPWDRLRRSQLAGLHFRRQQVIKGFIVDFYCDSAGLAIEVDGEAHSERQEYDVERDAILAQYGVLVIRFENHRVRDDIEMVLAQIVSVAKS